MPADDVGMVGWLWGFAWTHVADLDGAFGEQVFDITVAEIEPVVKPDSVTSDIRRESVAPISIHQSILSISGSLLDYTQLSVSAGLATIPAPEKGSLIFTPGRGPYFFQELAI